MKKKTLYLIGGLVLLVIILLVLKSMGIIGKKPEIKVAVEKAAYRNIVETVTASGKIFPEVEVSVSSDVSGEITDLPILEGDSVTKGQVIAKIYADIYNSIRERSAASVSQTAAQLENTKASLGAFRATLDEQKAAFDRNKKLFDLKVISRQEFEQSQSTYQQALANYNAAEQQIKSSHFALAGAQADLSQAVENLRRTTITSPMSGYVTYLPVKRGERVVGTAQMAGTEMLRIADMGVMEVQVDVGENDVPKVFLGDTALIEVDAYLNRKFKGIVTQIASSSQDMATSQTTTASGGGSSASQVTNYTVHIRIRKDSYADLLDPAHAEHFPFRPGMSANVDIQTKHHINVLSVPISAVTTNTGAADSTAKGKNKNKPDSSDLAQQPAPPDTAAHKTGGASGPANVVVYVLQTDNTVKPVPVKTDIQDDNYIEILSGLKDGEQVVSGPYTAISHLLKNGSRVKVVPKNMLFEAAP